VTSSLPHLELYIYCDEIQVTRSCVMVEAMKNLGFLGIGRKFPISGDISFALLSNCFWYDANDVGPPCSSLRNHSSKD